MIVYIDEVPQTILQADSTTRFVQRLGVMIEGCDGEVFVSGLVSLLQRKGFSETAIAGHIETILENLTASFETDRPSSIESLARRARQLVDQIPPPSTPAIPKSPQNQHVLQLVQLMRVLAPRDRKVMTMTYVNGLTSAEIAQRLSMAESEVSRRKQSVKAEFHRVCGL